MYFFVDPLTKFSFRKIEIEPITILVPGLVEDLIDGWQCSICQDMDLVRPLPVNTSSLFSLFKGTFNI